LSALATAVRRLGRYMIIYAASFAATLMLGLLITAVLTHALGPAAYGRLGVLLFSAAFLTVLLNLGSLQGTFGLAHGGSGEDSVPPPANGGAPDRAAAGEAQRRAVGTGLILTLGLGALAMVPIALVSRDLSTLLLHDTTYGTEIVVVAASAVLASGWRLAGNILRYDQRPIAFAIGQVSRPAAILICAVVLLTQNGRPVRLAVDSYAVGSGISLAVVIALVSKDVTFAFVPRLVGRIYRLGSSMAGVALSFFLIQSAGLLLLSLYADAHTVGVYRLAGSLVTPAQYAVSAFLLAWGPLSTAPVWLAMTRESGQEGADAGLGLYYVIGVAWTLIALSALAEPLTHIAPSSYRSAANLIPVMALTPLARGWLVVTYRVSHAADARATFIGSTILGAVAWLGMSLALIPAFGAYGAAVAPAIGLLLASLVVIARAAAARQPVSLPWRRIGAVLGVAAAIVVAERVLAPTGASWRTAVLISVATPAFPVLLIAMKVIPRSHSAQIVVIGGSVRPSLRSGRNVRARFDSLDQPDTDVIRAFLSRPAQRTDVADSAAAADFIRALSTVAAVEAPQNDVATTDLARYLLERLPMAKRQALGARLAHADDGIDPLVLDRLCETVKRLRRLRVMPPC